MSAPVRVPVSRANRGQALEQLLAREHARYLARGIARIDKHPTPWVPRRQGGQIVGGRPTGLAVADFQGVRLSDGVGICMEAKESHDASLPWRRIAPQQIEHLDAYLQAGAVAALVVWWLPDPRAPKGSARRVRSEIWAVPWRECRRLMAEGVPWLRWTEPPQGDTWRVRGPGACDWLGTLAAAERGASG